MNTETNVVLPLPAIPNTIIATESKDYYSFSNSFNFSYAD